MNSSLSLSLARSLALFWGKDRNIERETEAEIGRRREKWAQRIPLSLLVMRGCRGAVAAPNYYQAAATAKSNGPCRAAAEAHQYEERERGKRERPQSPQFTPVTPCSVPLPHQLACTSSVCLINFSGPKLQGGVWELRL